VNVTAIFSVQARSNRPCSIVRSLGPTLLSAVVADVAIAV
jgi:hypothetical protein